MKNKTDEKEEKEGFNYNMAECDLYSVKYFEYPSGMMVEISRELMAKGISLPQARMIAGKEDDRYGSNDT